MTVSLLAALGTSLACSNGKGPAGPDPTRDSYPRNVILIVVDAMRADHMGAYGYHRDTTPNLDRFASRGTRFNRAYSSASWTLPSIASLMTSVYPEVHGLRRPPTESDASSLSGEFLTLAESLHAAGLRTASITSQPWISDRTGLTQGFDEVRTVSHASAPGEARVLTEALLGWLAVHGEQPFFLYAHYMGPHSPYDVASGYSGRFTGGLEIPSAVEEFHRIYEQRSEVDAYRLISQRAREGGLDGEAVDYLRAEYDEKLAYTDQWLGTLFRHLEESGRLDDSLLIVTADHGEAFYEHGTIFHGQHLYEELVRVPLIVHLPGLSGARSHSDQVVELIDLYPTIHDALNLPLPAGILGESLVPVMQGGPSDGLALAEYYGFKVITPRWSSFYEYSDRMHLRSGFAISELYDLESDPGERRNLAFSRPDEVDRQAEIAYRLWGRLSEASRQRPLSPEPIELDDDTIEKLQSLGYLTGG
jgi:arylsulfatase